MSLSISASSRPNWSRLWQMPTLLVGLAVFAYGSFTVYKTLARRTVPFETHVADARHLLEQKDYQGAIQYINTLAQHFVAPDQQAQLEALAGDAYFIAPANPENYKGVIEHYQKAQALGWPKHGMAEQQQIDQRWATCAAALGDYPTAVERYERAIAADPNLVQNFGRQLIDAYQKILPPQTVKALTLLEKLGIHPGDVDDQVWALSKRIELLNGQPGLAKAITDAEALSKTIKERDPSGRLLTAIGRAQFELGQLPLAEQDLLEARKQFVEHNLDDGRAALLLGKIAQAKTEYDRAGTYYQEVITSHVGTPIFAAGRFGRAEIQALQGQDNDQMDGDYRYAIAQVCAGKGTSRGFVSNCEMLSEDAIRSSLAQHMQTSQRAGKFDAALHFIELQRLLPEPDSADTVLTEADIHERRGDELMAEADAMPPGKLRDEKRQEALGHYSAAADGYLRHSKLETMDSDTSAASLWKAAGLFDKAGRTTQAIDAYQQFITGFPTDSLVPEGVLDIGQLYQSLGQYEKAIPYYQRNLKENPNSTPAYLSSVQLAQCYMAMGDKFYPQAEQTLLAVVQDSKTLEPNALEFRASVFTLAELYYRSHRWSDAILRLQEAIARYPDDPAISQARFWLADSYRKSATAIADAIAADPQIAQRDALLQARHDRLVHAGEVFSDLIRVLDDPSRDIQSLPAIQQDYLRYSYLNRADCSYDLGDYPNAIKLYDGAASRFGQSLTAVDAYVQIVNAYLAMKQPEQAAAAAERARWILQHIPDNAFGSPPLALSRNYYEDILQVAKQ